MTGTCFYPAAAPRDEVNGKSHSLPLRPGEG